MKTRQVDIPMQQHTLLIVDDEMENREALSDLFADTYRLRFAENGSEGVEIANQGGVDLILLDVVMPVMDGFQACLKLRKNEATQHIPVIFLTSKNSPESESFGLELGADDFIIKPFNKEVLKLRVKKRLTYGAALEETNTQEQDTPLGDYTISWVRQEVSNEQVSIALTSKEMALLNLLVSNPNRVMSRARILQKVWPDTYITDRTIDSHVKGLRKKIPPLIHLLKTIYGSGYRLDLSL